MQKKQVVLSWSGGKDSALALAALRREGEYDVVGLLTSVTREYDRISVHGVRRSLLRAQAESVGLPLTEITLEKNCTNESYEAAFRQALQTLKEQRSHVRHLAFGDLFLEDVRAYRERQLAPTRLTPIFPLWGRDTAALAREMVAGGLRARITCVDPRQLAASFAGRDFDLALLESLLQPTASQLAGIDREASSGTLEIAPCWPRWFCLSGARAASSPSR